MVAPYGAGSWPTMHAGAGPGRHLHHGVWAGRSAHLEGDRNPHSEGARRTDASSTEHKMTRPQTREPSNRSMRMP